MKKSSLNAGTLNRGFTVYEMNFQGCFMQVFKRLKILSVANLVSWYENEMERMWESNNGLN
jgi:hypothetical protein